MKRWIVKEGATSLDGLVLEEAPMPEPGRGEVRVKVRAVSLNARDQLIIKGQYGVATGDFIAISDGAGEIDAIGSDVDGWSPGDKVTGLYFKNWIDGPPPPGQGWGLGSDGEDGMLAEYVVLKADRVTPTAQTLSFEEAACLPCAGLTAWSALNGNRPYRNRVGLGDKVLVTGTGSVAQFALLFAKAAGAETAATTSQDEKIDKVRALGATTVVNYADDPAWGETAATTSGGFDRVVNAAGGAALDQSIAALAPGGEIAFMGLYEQAEAAPNFPALMSVGGSIRGIGVGSAMAYKDMVEFIDEHGMKPVIAQTFALDDAKDAYEAAASSKHFGKVVIKISAN